jgi:hypothetical protein
MFKICLPDFGDEAPPQQCQLCRKRQGTVIGGRVPRRFSFCLRCAFEVLPAAIAGAAVRGQRRRSAAEKAALQACRALTDCFWDGLRLDDDCPLALSWIDDVGRRILDAMPAVVPSGWASESRPGPRERPCGAADRPL